MKKQELKNSQQNTEKEQNLRTDTTLIPDL